MLNVCDICCVRCLYWFCVGLLFNLVVWDCFYGVCWVDWEIVIVVWLLYCECGLFVYGWCCSGVWIVWLLLCVCFCGVYGWVGYIVCLGVRCYWLCLCGWYWAL